MTCKERENRARKEAQRQGLRLMKSQATDSRAVGFGCFSIVDVNTGIVEAGNSCSTLLNLKEVEAYLKG